MLSVAIGGKLVSAKNAYEGYMKNISINPNFPTFGPHDLWRKNGSCQEFLHSRSNLFNSLPALAARCRQLQPAITAGYGTVLLANGASIGMSRHQSREYSHFWEQRGWLRSRWCSNYFGGPDRIEYSFTRLPCKSRCNDRLCRQNIWCCCGCWTVRKSFYSDPQR